MSADDVEDIYELSPLQQGILFHSMYDGAADIYLSQHIYVVNGPLNPRLLAQAWQNVLANHPALRTSFHWEGLEKPLQVVHHEVVLPVEHHDWSELTDDQRSHRLDTLRAADRASGMDVTTAPLQRLKLIRTGASEHCIVWTYHHILMDGWSVPVLMADLLYQYGALTGSGEPPPPAAPPFRDYIGWLQRQDPNSTKDFWRKLLAGLDAAGQIPLAPLEVSADSSPLDPSWARRVIDLPRPIVEALPEVAARNRVTVGTLIQAAWAIVLATYSGDPDVVIGCPTSGRPVDLPAAESIIGVFANTLPLRITVPEGGELGPWLRDIQQTFAEMRRYEYTPLSDIKKWAGLPGRQLFQLVLSLESYPSNVRASDTLTFRQEGIYDTIGYPMAISVTPSTGTMNIGIQAQRFPPGFIDDLQTRAADTFRAIVTHSDLAGLTREPGPPLTLDPRPIPRRASGDADHSALEQAITEVYAEVLGLSEVDPTASFFDLGGDSFDAVRAVGRISGGNVGLLAANPSAREFAHALAVADPDQPTRHELVPVPRTGSLACTYQQEGMWFMNQFHAASTAYHIPFALRLRGPFDVLAMERALHTLVVRHEALRTRFVNDGGLPRQVIDPPPASMSLSTVDLAPDRAEEWAAELCNRPFDLAAGPGFRAAAARVHPDEHILAMVLHHIVCDGWSVGVMGAELSALYAAESTGVPADLPALLLQPADYAAWQRRWLAEDELERQVGFWRDTLADLSHVDLPTDRPRPADPTGAGGGLGQRLPAGIADAARGYVRTSHVSLLAVLQAALLTVLHRYTGQLDLPIGSIVSGRSHPETESMVGYLGNVLVLRADLSGRPTFAELIDRCHQTILDATAHQEVAFGLVVDALRPTRMTGRNPLFQIGLTLHPTGLSAELQLGDVSAEGVEVPEYYALYDLEVDVTDSAEGHLDLDIDYSAELFDADRIVRFMDHYVAALAGGLDNPDTVIDLLPGLPPTRDGTVGSSALSRSALSGGRPVGRSVAPRTDTERWIVTSWQKLLGPTEVGAGANFFDLGGNSLHATQFIASLRDSLGIELPVRRLFTDPVLEQFAAVVDEQLARRLDRFTEAPLA